MGYIGTDADVIVVPDPIKAPQFVPSTPAKPDVPDWLDPNTATPAPERETVPVAPERKDKEREADKHFA